jgi:hydrogenase nickel incorporation protein HypA/HybF
MHELSVVMNIISIAAQEAAKNNAAGIEEIEMDIGLLSGIEMAAFDFAWEQAVKGTLLEKAVKNINRIEGKGVCIDCNANFAIHQLYDPCPVCGQHFITIQKGKELRVKSLVIAETPGNAQQTMLNKKCSTNNAQQTTINEQRSTN